METDRLTDRRPGVVHLRIRIPAVAVGEAEHPTDLRPEAAQSLIIIPAVVGEAEASPAHRQVQAPEDRTEKRFRYRVARTSSQ